MHDPAYELPRIPLLGTWENEGKERKGRGECASAPTLAANPFYRASFRTAKGTKHKLAQAMEAGVSNSSCHRPDSPLLDPRSVGSRSRKHVEGFASMPGDRVNPSVPFLRPPYC
jgi:hypothetical protein